MLPLDSLSFGALALPSAELLCVMAPRGAPRRRGASRTPVSFMAAEGRWAEDSVQHRMVLVAIVSQMASFCHAGVMVGDYLAARSFPDGRTPSFPCFFLSVQHPKLAPQPPPSTHTRMGNCCERKAARAPQDGGDLLELLCGGERDEHSDDPSRFQQSHHDSDGSLASEKAMKDTNPDSRAAPQPIPNRRAVGHTNPSAQQTEEGASNNAAAHEDHQHPQNPHQQQESSSATGALAAAAAEVTPSAVQPAEKRSRAPSPDENSSPDSPRSQTPAPRRNYPRKGAFHQPRNMMMEGNNQAGFEQLEQEVLPKVDELLSKIEHKLNLGTEDSVQAQLDLRAACFVLAGGAANRPSKEERLYEPWQCAMDRTKALVERLVPIAKENPKPSPLPYGRGTPSKGPLDHTGFFPMLFRHDIFANFREVVRGYYDVKNTQLMLQRVTGWCWPDDIVKILIDDVNHPTTQFPTFKKEMKDTETLSATEELRASVQARMALFEGKELPPLASPVPKHITPTRPPDSDRMSAYQRAFDQLCGDLCRMHDAPGTEPYTSCYRKVMGALYNDCLFLGMKMEELATEGEPHIAWHFLVAILETLDEFGHDNSPLSSDEAQGIADAVNEHMGYDSGCTQWPTGRVGLMGSLLTIRTIYGIDASLAQFADLLENASQPEIMLAYMKMFTPLRKPYTRGYTINERIAEARPDVMFSMPMLSRMLMIPDMTPNHTMAPRRYSTTIEQAITLYECMTLGSFNNEANAAEYRRLTDNLYYEVVSFLALSRMEPTTVTPLLYRQVEESFNMLDKGRQQEPASSEKLNNDVAPLAIFGRYVTLNGFTNSCKGSVFLLDELRRCTPVADNVDVSTIRWAFPWLDGAMDFTQLMEQYDRYLKLDPTDQLRRASRLPLTGGGGKAGKQPAPDDKDPSGALMQQLRSGAVQDKDVLHAFAEQQPKAAPRGETVARLQRRYEQRDKERREAGPEKDKQKSPEEVEKELQKRAKDEARAKRAEAELLALEGAAAAAAAGSGGGVNNPKAKNQPNQPQQPGGGGEKKRKGKKKFGKRGGAKNKGPKHPDAANTPDADDQDHEQEQDDDHENEQQEDDQEQDQDHERDDLVHPGPSTSSNLDDTEEVQQGDTVHEEQQQQQGLGVGVAVGEGEGDGWGNFGDDNHGNSGEYAHPSRAPTFPPAAAAAAAVPEMAHSPWQHSDGEQPLRVAFDDHDQVDDQQGYGGEYGEGVGGEEGEGEGEEVPEFQGNMFDEEEGEAQEPTQQEDVGNGSCSGDQPSASSPSLASSNLHNLLMLQPNMYHADGSLPSTSSLGGSPGPHHLTHDTKPFIPGGIMHTGGMAVGKPGYGGMDMGIGIGHAAELHAQQEHLREHIVCPVRHQQQAPRQQQQQQYGHPQPSPEMQPPFANQQFSQNVAAAPYQQPGPSPSFMHTAPPGMVPPGAGPPGMIPSGPLPPAGASPSASPGTPFQSGHFSHSGSSLDMMQQPMQQQQQQVQMGQGVAGGWGVGVGVGVGGGDMLAQLQREYVAAMSLQFGHSSEGQMTDAVQQEIQSLHDEARLEQLTQASRHVAKHMEKLKDRATDFRVAFANQKAAAANCKAQMMEQQMQEMVKQTDLQTKERERHFQEHLRTVQDTMQAENDQIKKEADAQLKEAKDKHDEKQQCCVCFERDKCVAFLPCRHLCVCQQCSNNIMSRTQAEDRLCPICQAAAARALSLFV
ncbi:unnamed protein product [Vitrella brassicaformis CCMP3155]|uniref:RING-type domain-containing protein n=1 Tax=Vitrella brassicaformis (strain CCMP3155) TaxID=1169540 RepID=A0A0G4FZQ0_VITBC|nr:unnamed protein product [Vitrella brassicaformis CCMP3155]|eukprot:CEM21122.1 unnamed protein product [Vitrella brassicaformis CCMP3155]